MASDTTKLLAILLELLPCYAQEGAKFETISRQSLVDTLINAGASLDASQAIVDMVENLFKISSLLDISELNRGNWQFVSFPASLAGKSLLSTLSTQGQTLFKDSFWFSDQQTSEGDIDNQRETLKWLEGNRQKYHPEKSPEPIRHVYVAWGIIRIGGQFLLLHREDKTRPHSHSFVMPGGRFNMFDLPVEDQTQENLPAISRADSQLAISNLPKTLRREIEEELELHEGVDYGFTHWKTISGYRQLEGTKNNLSNTQYHFELYLISLTQKGELHLYDFLSGLETRKQGWFSLDELQKKISDDGKPAFIDALHSALGEDFPEILGSIPDAIDSAYRFNEEKDAADFPFQANAELLKGRSGKEKALQISLTNEERSLLIGLACHSKNLEFASLNETVLLPNGWVGLRQDAQIRLAETLAEKLANLDYPVVEIRDHRYVRISIDPKWVFLETALYSYDLKQVDQDGYKNAMEIIFPSLQTGIGSTSPVRRSFSISEAALDIIDMINASQNPGSRYDVEKNIREQVDKHTRPLGLRKFVRLNHEQYFLTIPKAE